MAEQRLVDANDVYKIIGQTGVARVRVADIDQIKRINPETLPIVQQLREALEKVTAERDAAIADLKTICDCDYCANNCVNAEESICEFCEVESCLCRGCVKGENWTWRGQQKDEDR